MNFLDNKKKYSYEYLSKSNCYEKILTISIFNSKKIFCQKYLFSKIDNLSNISKFIDKKINNNLQKFRAKNDFILIEQIASVVANFVFTKEKCRLFSEFKKYQITYKLKQKEIKIFKVLLGRFLIDILYDIESEIEEISKIIYNSKSSKKLKKYKKQIYNLAQIYSIKKFNKNANKILYKCKYDYTFVMKNLFTELTDALQIQKVIISYLIVIFSN